MKVDPEIVAAAQGRTLNTETRGRLLRSLAESPTFSRRVREILSRQPNDVELDMLVTEIAADLYDHGYEIVRAKVGAR